MDHSFARAQGLGAEIERARISRRITQRGLAASSGVSRATIANLEAGRGSSAALSTILKVLDWSFYEQPHDIGLGAWVKERRQAAKFSQERFCATARISKPALVKIERGGGNLLTLVKALAALGTTMTLRPGENSAVPKLTASAVMSPLRYPGGKSRALPFLAKHMPDHIEEYREPFVGGASMALFVSQKHPNARIWINDAYAPLISFWRTLQDPVATELLVAQLIQLRLQHRDTGAAKALFGQLRSLIEQPNADDGTRALSFYVLNRCSFSGLGPSGSFSPESAEKRWTLQSIRRLEKLTDIVKHWRVTNLDYEVVFREPWSKTHTFSFVDPPYEVVGERLYGAQYGALPFDHARLRDVIGAIPARTMITYNHNSTLMKQFADWRHIGWDLSYSVQSNASYKSKQQRRQELLILNYPPA